MVGDLFIHYLRRERGSLFCLGIVLLSWLLLTEIEESRDGEGW
jgi:hypothetical protein